MTPLSRTLRAAFAVAAGAFGAATATFAADQTLPGAGNASADLVAAASPRVHQAHRFLVERAREIKNPALPSNNIEISVYL